MSVDPIYYSEVLADLQARRDALTNRMTNIESAIEGIRGLLDGGSIPPVPLSDVPAQERLLATELVAAEPPVRIQSSVVDLRQRETALNVYVNPYPEWGRAMAKGKTISRKKNSVRCPKCGSCDTRQSFTRGFSDFVLFLFDFMNARCRNCNSRFRVWRTPEAQAMLGQAVPGTE